HPSPRLSRDAGTCLEHAGRLAKDRTQPPEIEVAALEARCDEEALHRALLSDDGDTVTVTDQLDLVIHHQLLAGWCTTDSREEPESHGTEPRDHVPDVTPLTDAD